MSVGPAPARHDAAADQKSRPPLVAVAGNPNTGKTSIFNNLTRQDARVANYPGVTVETRLGRMTLARRGGSQTVEVVDVPGCYSLSARSPEERIAIDTILGWNGCARPDVVVLVLDSTQLVRNLYLALQVLEFGVPCVLALNMSDEIAGDQPDAERIGALFGVPCVSTSARTGAGLAALRDAIARVLDEPPQPRPQVQYPQTLLHDAQQLAAALPANWPPGRSEASQALALWCLTSLDDEDEFDDVPDDVRQQVRQLRAAAGNRDIEAEIITSRYELLQAHVSAAHRSRHHRRTEGVDRLLLHPVSGFATFLILMLLLFQSLFAGADPMISWIEGAFGWLARGVSAVLPSGFLRDLAVEGIIGGVGNVLVFLPQILMLFFFIGLLEDLGYMARVAYLMDRIMRSLGLHGRAFVPLLSGFACAIPAILATRTMERRRDRLLTMLVIPLMTCSARLPVYTLIIAALYPPSKVFGFVPVQGLLMVAMYLFSTLVALAAAAVLGRTLLKGPPVPLVLELPPYRLPMAGTVLRMMWMRTRSFLSEAGSVILVCTVILWALLSFPKPPEPAAPSQQTAIEYSIGGRMGKLIEPAIEPLGFDWKIGVGLIGAFAAREVFVSTMGVIYGVGDDADEQSVALRDRLRTEMRADGRPVYNPLVGLSLMVFFALACQCMSTLAVVRRETHGWRWPIFLFVYMTALAWLASFAVYQGGRLLGVG